MARSDMFLKITSQKAGLIVGESNDKNFANQIEVVDWEWSMGAPSAIGTAPGGRRQLRELKVVKAADKASTALMAVLDTNDIITTLVLSVRKSGGASPLPYFVVTLGKARIVEYSVQSDVTSTGAPVLTEHLSFAFKSIQIDYTLQTGTGGSGGGYSFSTDTGER